MAFCPYCGAQIPDGATFCAQCGQPLAPPVQNPGYYSAPAPQPAPRPAPAPKKKKGGLGIILILLILIVGGYFLYNYHDPFGGKTKEGSGRPDLTPKEYSQPESGDAATKNKEYKDWLLGD